MLTQDYIKHCQMALTSVLLIISTIFNPIVQSNFVLAKCNENLSSNTTTVPNSAFTSSSVASLEHQAHNARYSNGFKNWCPSQAFTNDLTEYIDIDLGSIYKIDSLLFYVKSYVRRDQELPLYIIQYKRELNGPWYRYSDEQKNCILRRNSQLDIEDLRNLNPPIIARWFRVYPYIEKGESHTCLSLELYGCQSQAIEYILPINEDIHPRIPRDNLLDTVYDARNLFQIDDLYSPTIDRMNLCDFKVSNPLLSDDNSWIKSHNGTSYFTSGLGKLSDRDISSDPSSNTFIGLHSQTNKGKSKILFRFDNVYQFKKILLHFAYPDDYKNINPILSVQAKVFPDIKGNIFAYLSDNEIKHDYHTKLTYFEYDSTSSWVDLNSQNEDFGKFVLLEMDLKAGWTLLDEVYFDMIKVDPNIKIPEKLEITTEKPNLLPSSSSLPSSTTEISSPEPLVTKTGEAPFGQFAITAILIICGFGIFLILSTILACFMMKNRRSSHKRNLSSNMENCDSFSKLNISQINQKPIMNFSDLQLFNQQQQSLIGVNQGTGSTNTTNDSLYAGGGVVAPSIPINGFHSNEQNYFTLSPQQQLMLLMAANGQLNCPNNNNNSNQTGDNSSALYASIRGEGPDTEENANCEIRGPLSPGNTRSSSNMPLPNPPGTIYGNQSLSAISPSLAQAHLLSQGNFQILPPNPNFDQNLHTLNSRSINDGSFSHQQQGVFSITQSPGNVFIPTTTTSNCVPNSYFPYLNTLQMVNQNMNQHQTMNNRQFDDPKF